MSDIDTDTTLADVRPSEWASDSELARQIDDAEEREDMRSFFAAAVGKLIGWGRVIGGVIVALLALAAIGLAIKSDLP